MVQLQISLCIIMDIPHDQYNSINANCTNYTPHKSIYNRLQRTNMRIYQDIVYFQISNVIICVQLAPTFLDLVLA